MTGGLRRGTYVSASRVDNLVFLANNLPHFRLKLLSM